MNTIKTYKTMYHTVLEKIRILEKQNKTIENDSRKLEAFKNRLIGAEYMLDMLIAKKKELNGY